MDNKLFADKKQPMIQFGCMSWVGAMLSTALIAVRAFQPGAQPIEAWSVSSWCLMLLPTFLPMALGFLVCAVWLLALLFIEVIAKTK